MWKFSVYCVYIDIINIFITLYNVITKYVFGELEFLS